jgi:hypothetical protein
MERREVLKALAAAVVLGPVLPVAPAAAIGVDITAGLSMHPATYLLESAAFGRLRIKAPEGWAIRWCDVEGWYCYSTEAVEMMPGVAYECTPCCPPREYKMSIV